MAKAPAAAFCTLSSSSPQSSTTNFSRSFPSARNLSCTYEKKECGSEKNALICPGWGGKGELEATFLDPDLSELSFEQLTHATFPRKSSLIS